MNKYDENAMIVDIKNNFDGEVKKSATTRLIESYLAWGRITETAKALAELDLTEDELDLIVREIKRWELDACCYEPSREQAERDSESRCWIIKAPFRNFRKGDKITHKQGGDQMVGGGLTPSMWVKVD